MTTTTTGIEIPACVTKPKTLTDVALAAADLLEQAQDHALATPRSVRLSRAGHDISLSFPGDRDTFGTLALWAERFGGTVTGEPYTCDDGRETVYTKLTFTHAGVSVEAYAFINADEADTAS
jgi:hypothetical protein